MKKTPEQLQEEKREIDQLVAHISSMICRVPITHNSWSYQRAVDYKETVKKARSEINKTRKNISTLRSAYSTLSMFYATA